MKLTIVDDSEYEDSELDAIYVNLIYLMMQRTDFVQLLSSLKHCSLVVAT